MSGYVPYGEEWRRDMARHTKEWLIDRLTTIAKERDYFQRRAYILQEERKIADSKNNKE